MEYSAFAYIDPVLLFVYDNVPEYISVNVMRVKIKRKPGTLKYSQPNILIATIYVSLLLSEELILYER